MIIRTERWKKTTDNTDLRAAGLSCGPFINMIVNERITTYIHSLETDNPAYLEELRAAAEKSSVPIIRREMESFLKVLLKAKEPKKILEIGTGTAFSAIYMASCSDAHITTIEKSAKRLKLAGKNILKTGLSDRISSFSATAA